MKSCSVLWDWVGFTVDCVYMGIGHDDGYPQALLWSTAIPGGGGVFRQGKISGPKFSFLRLVPNPLPRKILAQSGPFLAPWVGLLTVFFCREALVPLYCTSGSVFMFVRIPNFFPGASFLSRRMILCTQRVSTKICLYIRRVSQGLWLPQLPTRYQNWGPKFSPPEIPPRPLYSHTG